MARGDKMRSDYDDYLRDDNLHINWYPGHMKKTRSLVKDNLKLENKKIDKNGFFIFLFVGILLPIIIFSLDYTNRFLEH